MKRLAGILVGLLIILGIGSVFRGEIALKLVERVAGQRMANDPMADLEDGLHVILCGAGSPLPDPKRSGPCVAVLAGDRLFLVDAGSSAARNVQGRALDIGRIDAAFLTHFHSDHIDGLGEVSMMRWVQGNNKTPLPLFGPSGVEEIADGFNVAYRQDATYRTAHHGADIVPPTGSGLDARPFDTPTPGNAVTIWEDGGVKVQALRVEHAPVEPAVGYRFDYGGRSILITGDTIRSAEIERMAKGIDVLVHEALAPNIVKVMQQSAEKAGATANAKILHDILDYHASPADAAASAEVAGAKHLLFYHVVPALIVPGMDVAFLEGVSDAYSGDVTLGEDGTHIALPAGSDEIDVRSR